ncbi:uncharacterized protein RSE6_09009 [Rhynchosporium secalis]|uniref:Uncharacterized protein n=1 Tax=Rhynchosporium secalis TaxID=38038 RepID=A0A1E1MGU8_RHYSE|nr:uncharacterized protein RSE6_09009 [Rhynchosporium secalis]
MWALTIPESESESESESDSVIARKMSTEARREKDVYLLCSPTTALCPYGLPTTYLLPYSYSYLQSTTSSPGSPEVGWPGAVLEALGVVEPGRTCHILYIHAHAHALSHAVSRSHTW